MKWKEVKAGSMPVGEKTDDDYKPNGCLVVGCDCSVCLLGSEELVLRGKLKMLGYTDEEIDKKFKELDDG